MNLKTADPASSSSEDSNILTLVVSATDKLKMGELQLSKGPAVSCQRAHREKLCPPALNAFVSTGTAFDLAACRKALEQHDQHVLLSLDVYVSA